MKRHAFAVSLAFGATALLMLARPVAAGERVFLGRLDGTFTNMLISENPPILFVHTSGSGRATQLGRYSFGMEHEVNLVNQSATGYIEFTAANGDRLHATFTGQGFSTPIPGVLATVETATISGGTGRFEDATGEFTIVRLVFADLSTTSGLFGGTICWRDR